MSSNVLKKQLELVRFEKTIDYVQASAGSQKHLNSSELAHLNNMLCNSSEDPWRVGPVTLTLPSGRQGHFSVISNSQKEASELINECRDMANNGELVEAATRLYSELVMKHLFKEGNRRTAVAATTWILFEHGIQIPAMGLLEMGLGDVREKDQMSSLRGVIEYGIRVAKRS
jgi:hypothetical protein